MARRSLSVGVLALALLAVLPDVAWACPVCFSNDDDSRIAFLATAGLLTFLPLGMVAGTAYWLRKRSQEDEDEDLHQ